MLSSNRAGPASTADLRRDQEARFFHTNTADVPSTIAKSNNRKRARRNAMRHFLSTLPYPNKDNRICGKPDPLTVGEAAPALGGSAHILGRSLHPEQRKAGEGGAED